MSNNSDKTPDSKLNKGKISKKSARLAITQALSRFSPPILSQTFRRLIYPYSAGIKDNYEFIVRSQTGSYLKSNTSHYVGHYFAIYGYFDWRNVAVAIALTCPGDTIFEIGANIGTETAGFSDILGPTGKVHAFEPLPINIKYLEDLKKRAQYSNITIHTKALSNKKSQVSFVVPTSDIPDFSGYISHNDSANHSNTIDVECVTLDSFGDELGIAKLIAIDTEGEDLRVIQGARNYILKHKPAVILEVCRYALGRNNLKPQDMYDEIISLNYIPFLISRFGVCKIQPKHFDIRIANWVCVDIDQQYLLKKVGKMIRRCGLLPCIPGLNPLSRRTKGVKKNKF